LLFELTDEDRKRRFQKTADRTFRQVRGEKITIEFERGYGFTEIRAIQNFATCPSVLPQRSHDSKRRDAPIPEIFGEKVRLPCGVAT